MITKKINQKELKREIKIPETIRLSLERKKVIVKKDSKIISRILPKEVMADINGEILTLSINKPRKNEKRQLGTNTGHIKNMINGLEKPFRFELEICNVHFPMTIEYDKSNGEFKIKNMLGEKTPRKLKIKNPEDIEVKIVPPKIFIESFNIEKAGDTASRLESVSRIRNRDRNKFQDGIFITKKPGKIYL